MTIANPTYRDRIWDADRNAWTDAKAVIGTKRLTLGPQASQQYLEAPEHLAMVLSRYRAAAALIGDARTILEAGSGEGMGARILAKGRQRYCGLDNDAEAVRIARETVGNEVIGFADLDLTTVAFLPGTIYDAVVSLDVIEHIPAVLEQAFMSTVTMALKTHGVCVVGTPSQHAEHLASPQSRAGHVNLFTPERLHALMARYFHVVQMAFMQDVSIHFGRPELAHYLIAVGIGPRRG